MAEFAQDVRFALRMLTRNWGVTLVSVLSLAIAIGGNATVFALIDTLLFRPLQVTEPERLVAFQERRREQPEGLSTLSVSLAAHADLADRSRTTGGWAALRPTILGLREDDRSEPISSGEVTASFFEVLGLSLQRGRTFLSDEAAPGGGKVAIITPELWSRIRGDGDPLGAVLTLSGEPVEIVGVLPEGFTFLFSNPELLVPLTDSPVGSPRDRRDVVSIARLSPSATMDEVRAETRAIATSLESAFPQTQRNWTLDVFNVRSDIPDSRTKIFYGLLQGSVFFVLLIACANIANLLLARAQERRREIALRTVLGAGRTRLARQLLTESSVLVALGAGLGLGFGWLGVRAMAAHFAGVLPANFTPALDGTVVLFTGALSVLAGLLFGLAPVIQTLKRAQSDVLREGGGKVSAGRGRKLVTRGLVVAEIALSLVALGGGGMLVRSFLDLQNTDPGFDGSDLVTAQIRLPESKYPSDEEKAALFQQVLERAQATSGARSAALVSALPMGFGTPTDTFRLDGDLGDGGAPAPQVFSLRASPGYADVLGIEVLQGRFFEDADRADQQPVAVVNRSFAERWSPETDPVGRHVLFDGESRLIVGVVDDVRQVLFRSPGQVESEAIYLPAAQASSTIYTLVVAADGLPGELKEPVRGDVQALDPDLTLSQVLTMEEVLDQAFVGISVFNTILGGFGILAILLASVGTYGVLAYQVTQRRHEIGIRIAVGARGREVVRMVATQGVWMALLGLALGAVVLVPLTRLIRGMLEGFAAVRGETGIAVAAVLFAVTLAASLVPAYRASSLDPVTTLRDE